MKRKSFLMALIACSLSFTSCSKDGIIPFSQLPQQAQQIVEQHFRDAEISVVMKDKDFLHTEYEVRFNNGNKVEFDKNGELTKADCCTQPVPDAILPEPVKQYVLTNFPNDYVTEWSKDDLHWKAELSSKLELIFSRKYQYVGLDD